jgi:hypothetical protein
MSVPSKQPSAPRAGSRIIPGVLLALACVAMFVVPSAYVIEREHSRWIALGVGAFAFPLLPLGWHGIAEWRRRRRAGTKSTLTAWDRLVLRSAVVAIVAIGGTFAIARGAAWTAVRHHALWFTDWSEPDPIAESALLARVPLGTEAIVWIRPGRTQELLPLALSGQAELVLAIGGDEMMVVMAAEEAVLDQLEPLAKLGLKGDRLAQIDAAPGMRILATPGWRTSLAIGPGALLDLMYRAPGDANAMAVGRWSSLGKQYPAGSFAGWAQVGETNVRFAGEAELANVAGADQLVELIRQYGKGLASSKDCGNRALAHATEPGLTREGTKVSGSFELDLEHARGIPRCMADAR